MLSLKSNQKALIIGDIHGCYDEFIELIQVSGIDPDNDLIISLGDIIDRGPYADKLIDYFMEHINTYMILGNHEIKHLRKSQFDIDDPSGSIQKKMVCEAVYNNMLDYFRKQPLNLTIEANDKKYLLLHAGITGNIKLENIPPHLENYEKVDEPLKTILGIGSQSRKGFDGKSAPWYEEINLADKIIYGHFITSEVVRGQRNNVYGLDTGCYEGGKLSALLLPEEKIIQVPSKKNYYYELLLKYLDTLYLENYTEFKWDKKLKILQNEYVSLTKDKINQELDGLKLIQTGIVTIAEKIRNLFDSTDNNTKTLIGKNWNLFLTSYPNLSVEIKSGLFKNYEINNLFKFDNQKLELIKNELSGIENNFEIEKENITKTYKRITNHN